MFCVNLTKKKVLVRVWLFFAIWPSYGPFRSLKPAHLLGPLPASGPPCPLVAKSIRAARKTGLVWVTTVANFHYHRNFTTKAAKEKQAGRKQEKRRSAWPTAPGSATPTTTADFGQTKPQELPMDVPKRPAQPVVTTGGHRCALSSRVCRPAGHGAAGHRCSVVPQSPVDSPAAAQARQLAIGAAWGRSRAKPSAPAKAKSGMLGWRIIPEGVAAVIGFCSLVARRRAPRPSDKHQGTEQCRCWRSGLAARGPWRSGQ